MELVVPKANAREAHTHSLRVRLFPGGSRPSFWIACALIGLISCAASSAAQGLEPELWGVDNNITGIVRSGNTIYVAGAFSQAGRNTGCGVPLDRITGKAAPSFPRVAGVLNAVIADGHGGWYIGGELVGVGGLPRTGVAHILADGSVSDWAPGCNGRALALALKGETLYVGGEFTEIGGQPRANLAAFDVITGSLQPWNPGANFRVHALLPADSTIYVGGNFSQIGGAARNSLAELHVATGLATPLNPDVGFYGSPSPVLVMTLLGDTLYIGGYFASVGGQQRFRAAAIDLRTSLPTAWNPHAQGFDNRYDAAPYVSALIPVKETMYVGGHFAFIQGQPRGGLAEVDLATGEPTAWNPTPRLTPGFEDFAPHVTSLVVTSGTVYASGNFRYMGQTEREYLAEVDRVTGGATSWDPRPNTIVDVLALSDEAIYAGGRFDFMGEWETRRNLAAFDATTGKLKDWNPDPDGVIVYDLAIHDGRVYVGGHFWTVGGAPRGAIAALDTIAGAALDWTADLDDLPFKLEIAGDRLYVGGLFTTVGGVARGRLASFDLKTGQLTDWNPNLDSDVYDLAINGEAVYAGGFFSTVGGAPRRFLAAIDAMTGEALDWDPQPDSWVQAIAVRDSKVFLGGAFRNIGGHPRSRLAALDARTGEVLDWVADAAHANPNFVRVYALELAGDNLYVGGSFHSIAGVARSGLAALDAQTGAVLPWDPAPSDPTTDYPRQPAVIWELTAHESTLYVGGRFRYVGTIPANTLAAISIDLPPLPGPGPSPSNVAVASIFPNPVRSGAAIRLSLPRAGRVDMGVFDVQGRQIGSAARSLALPAGVHEIPLTATDWSEGFYFLRLEVDGIVATRKFVVIR